MATTMTVALYDWRYAPQGQVADFTSCSVDWVHLDVGTGELVISESSVFAPLLLSIPLAPVLIKVIVNGVSWVGRVVTVDLDRTGKRGTGTITAGLVSETVWLKYLLASQGGTSTALSGLPEFDTQTGPAATVAAYYINAAGTRTRAPVVALAPVGDTTGAVTLQARLPLTLADLLLPTLVAQGVILDVDVITDRSRFPINQQPETMPVIGFTLRQPASNPSIRWSDVANQLSEVHLQLGGATGYRAIVGLGGDGTAAAYDLVVDAPDTGNGGPYALSEVFVDASGVATGVDSQQAGQNELFNHRGITTASFTVLDGRPWTFGEDYLAGDVGAVTVGGVSVLERISKVNATFSASDGLTITPTLGDLVLTERAEILVLRAVASVQTQVRMLQASR